MIAYNQQWLEHLYIQNQARESFKRDCITEEERKQIKIKYPASFYTPNFFIRAGLFLLTGIVLSFSLSLLFLMFLGEIDKAGKILCFISGILNIVVLEYFIREKRHYRSGIDDALLWGGILFLFGATNIDTSYSYFTYTIIFFLLTLTAAVRYADALVAVICYLCFLMAIYYAFENAGTFIKSLLPFLLIIVSFVMYFWMHQKRKSKKFSVYFYCFSCIEITSLLTLYVAGNYFVVRELSNEMFNLHLLPGQAIPYGFVFWIFTIAIPIIYLFVGIQRKDRVLLRAGFILIAATVFTIRYYHAILVAEGAMMLAGSILLIIAWGLTRYLKTPKHGFTSQEDLLANEAKLQVEALVIAQTLSSQNAGDKTQFGGGSFGGGGASGEF